MKSNIIIPKKIKVGFNPRTDTYTGMLGYVIYHDGKIWRKEPSWEKWRTKYMDPDEFEEKKKNQYDGRMKQQTEYFNSIKDDANSDYLKSYVKLGLEGYLKKFVAESYEKFNPQLGNVSKDKGIIPVEYPNEPLEGFVLNRKAGGYSTGWNHRQTYCRVYDPRGFEFEITIPNLLYILENANSTVGKGLEGKFIYGWEGKDLVLVPENAPEYKDMIRFTELQDKKVSKKDLIPGKIYITDQNTKVVYLENDYSYGYNGLRSTTKQLWFGYISTYSEDKQITTYPIKSIKECTNEIDEEYAEYMEILYKNAYHTPTKIAEYTYEPVTAQYVTSRRYFYNTDYYILENGKYKKRYLIKNRGDYALSRKRHNIDYDECEFLPLNKLIATTPFYKREITTIKK